MIIPEKVKIGGTIWTVEFSDTILDDEEAGKCFSLHQKIVIANNIHRQQQEMTFLHELIHACIRQSGLSEKTKYTEEEFISALEAPFYSLLKENKLTED